MAADTYYTIDRPAGPVVFKDRKSKFLGYAFPVASIDKVKMEVEKLKRAHHSARHWCYAYRVGVEKLVERANDDGEPSNSAGQPILNQIKAKNLTNVLVVVVRYFGGVKLGVGGLINAYKSAAQMVLDQAEPVEKIRKRNLKIIFNYGDMDKVMRLIKEFDLEIISQNLQENGEIIVAIRLDDFEKVKKQFEAVHTLTVTELE